MNSSTINGAKIDAIDRRIVLTTQRGMSLVDRPYDEIASQVGITANEVKYRLETMLENRIIRRIGVVPNHYRLGFVASGMSVWDVEERVVDKFGVLVGALDYVSHCYKRPRNPPLWPYNLFAEVHATSRLEVEEKVAAIAGVLSGVCCDHEILYPIRTLKNQHRILKGSNPQLQ